KAGQSKTVSSKEGKPTGLAGEYTLKKKKSGDHEVIVNIDVTQGAFGVGKDQMHDRIKTCMKEVSPFMKGPDGKGLEIKIISPKEIFDFPVNERPAINKVDIQSPGFRSHSRSYQADIDCPTIAHEVLHLLGICDEYDGNADGYSCRTV